MLLPGRASQLSLLVKLFTVTGAALALGYELLEHTDSSITFPRGATPLPPPPAAGPAAGTAAAPALAVASPEAAAAAAAPHR